MKYKLFFLIIVFFSSCYNVINFPYKCTTFHKSKSKSDIIKSIKYYYRKKTEQNTIVVNFGSNSIVTEIEITFFNDGSKVKIIKCISNEKILSCVDFKGLRNRNLKFNTLLISDTVNFRKPMLNNVYVGPDDEGLDIFKNINRTDVVIEKVSDSEKKILTKTYEICLKHGIKLNPFDTTKFVAWMKYIGKCD